MPRYVICGPRITSDGLWGATCYISKSGYSTHNAERAFVYQSLSDAQDELAYWNGPTGMPNYRWRIEKLPPRLSVANAVLRAVPVELEHCDIGGEG